MRSHFYLLDMTAFRLSLPFFFGLLFDPHAHAYNPFNSQRYTLMAEDAVESAGAKAPAITISIQQFIAGLEVLCHQTIDVPRFIPNSESGASEWQNIALARGLITQPSERTGLTRSGRMSTGPRLCTTILDCGYRVCRHWLRKEIKWKPKERVKI